MRSLNGRPAKLPVVVTFDNFCIKLNNALIKPFSNQEKLKEFYITYLGNQEAKTVNWIKNWGYDSVEEWSEWYFDKWDFDKHNTILKSKFLTKYNNIMPDAKTRI